MSNDLVPSPDRGRDAEYPPAGYVDVDPPPGYEDDYESGQIDWRRYLAAVLRFKWLVLAVAVAGTIAGFGATRFIEPKYEAEATIWVEVAGRAQAGSGPIRSSGLLRSYSWMDLLKTYLVLDDVVRERRLYLSPESPDARRALDGFQIGDELVAGEYELMVDASGEQFELRARSGQLLQRGSVGDSIGPELGFRWAPTADELEPDARLSFQVSNLRDVSSDLTSRLKTEMDPNGNFLRVSMRGTNPGGVARTLNAVIQRYVQVAADLKSAKVEELTKILDEQLRVAAGQLQRAEESLEDFRVETVTLPSENATPVNPGVAMSRGAGYSNYFTLKVESEQLRRDRESIERVLAAARDSALSVEALEVIPAVRNVTELTGALTELTTRRAELRALQNRYTEAAEPIQNRQRAIRRLEEDVIPGLARSLVSELRAREQELAGLIEAAGTELAEIPTRKIEEARLERDVRIQSSLYTNLQARYEEARLAAASSIPDVRILDRAVAPRQPVNRKDILRLLLLAAIGSLGLGMAGAVVLDYMDPRVRYPDQISKELGLPILGTVPRVNERTLVNSSGAAAQVVEAFRVIRLNLLHAYGSAGPMVFTVTSPESLDGKSFVSANLGLAFAELGRRTLVIDGDVRRGTQHRLLNCSRKPGLIDSLSGSVDKDSVILGTSHTNLHLIPSGTRRQDGPELLQSNDMAAYLAELRGRFDVIILDSPPLAAGVDPLALGTLTGNMVVVLRTGATDRALTTAKLDMLYRLPIRVLGAIMNAVPPRGAGYYHPYYSYLPGYEAVDEETGKLEPGRAVATLGPEREDDFDDRGGDDRGEGPASESGSGLDVGRVIHPSEHQEAHAASNDEASDPESPGPPDPKKQPTEPSIPEAASDETPQPSSAKRPRNSSGSKKKSPKRRRTKKRTTTTTKPVSGSGGEPDNGRQEMSSSLLSERTRAAVEEVVRQAQVILQALDDLSEAGMPDGMPATPTPMPPVRPPKRPILRATKVPFKPMDATEKARAHRAHQRRVQHWSLDKNGRRNGSKPPPHSHS